MIDSHCHLADEAFLADLDEAIARAQAAGVTRALCILSAGDEAEAVRARGGWSRWRAVLFATGVHPHSAGHLAGGAASPAEVPRRHAARVSARDIGGHGLADPYDLGRPVVGR